MFPLSEQLFPFSEHVFPPSEQLFPFSEHVFPPSEQLFPFSEHVFPFSEQLFPFLGLVFPLCRCGLAKEALKTLTEARRLGAKQRGNRRSICSPKKN